MGRWELGGGLGAYAIQAKDDFDWGGGGRFAERGDCALGASNAPRTTAMGRAAIDRDLQWPGAWPGKWSGTSPNNEPAIGKTFDLVAAKFAFLDLCRISRFAFLSIWLCYSVYDLRLLAPFIPR